MESWATWAQSYLNLLLPIMFAAGNDAPDATSLLPTHRHTQPNVPTLQHKTNASGWQQWLPLAGQSIVHDGSRSARI